MYSRTLPMVTNPRTGVVKRVRNLGWLLRHAKQTVYITVKALYDKDGRANGEAMLIATVCLEDRIVGTDDGDVVQYKAHFASAEIARKFVQRRAFAHATVTID